MAVKAVHLANREHADSAERLRRHGQNLALGDVGLQNAVLVRLQAVERDVAGHDVALERAARDVRLAAVLEAAVHDELIPHRAAGQPAHGRVAAVEAHERLVEAVVELAADVRVVHVGGHGVVDVQQRNRRAGHAGADVLRQRAVDVHLAGDADAHRRQPGVDIAGHEAELRLKRRPALVRHHDVLRAAAVLLDPVQERQLVLREPRQDAGHLVARAQLGLHLRDLRRDARVALVLLVRLEQVELGVLLDVDAQLKQRRDRRVAGQKVKWPRAERDDLQVLQPQQRAGDRGEFEDHVRALGRGADGIFGNVGRDAAELQVVARVEHAAERVAPVAGEHGGVLLRRRDVHDRACELLRDQRLRALGAKVAQIDDQRVDAGAAEVLVGLHDVAVDAALDDDRALIDLAALFADGRDDGPAARLRKRDREAVAADRDDAHPNLWNVVHGSSPPCAVAFPPADYDTKLPLPRQYPVFGRCAFLRI